MCWLDASCLLPLRVSARLLCFARSGAHEHELQASTSACEYLLALPDFPLKLTPPSSSSPPACLPVVVVVVVVLYFLPPHRRHVLTSALLAFTRFPHKLRSVLCFLRTVLLQTCAAMLHRGVACRPAGGGCCLLLAIMKRRDNINHVFRMSEYLPVFSFSHLPHLLSCSAQLLRHRVKCADCGAACILLQACESGIKMSFPPHMFHNHIWPSRHSDGVFRP